jgi:excisionase family DNA binding protein
MKSPFLTLTEAATYLRVSRQTLYRWCAEGKIAPRKHGKQLMFTEEYLLKWSTSQARTAKRLL